MSDRYSGRWEELDNFYQVTLNNNMHNSELFTLNKKDIKGAIVSGLIVGLFAIIAYILQVGNIFDIDLRVAANAGTMAMLTSIASVFKNFLTTEEGNFCGIISVK